MLVNTLFIEFIIKITLLFILAYLFYVLVETL